MKRISIIMAFLCVCFSANAQLPACKLTRDTFYYVTLDIRSKNDYPILMNGVTKSFRMKDLNTHNKNAFIGSFYRKSFYTPEPLSGYKKMLLKCMGDSLGYIYLKEHPASSSLILNKFNKYSLKKKLLLESGESVYLNIAKISASFLRTNKTDPGISKNSNELDISDLKEVEVCYVPFKVFYYKKPRKSKVFE